MMTSTASGGGTADSNHSNQSAKGVSNAPSSRPNLQNVKSRREIGARGGVSINVKEFKIHERRCCKATELPSYQAQRINALVFYFFIFFSLVFFPSFLPVPHSAAPCRSLSHSVSLFVATFSSCRCPLSVEAFSRSLDPVVWHR